MPKNLPGPGTMYLLYSPLVGPTKSFSHFLPSCLAAPSKALVSISIVELIIVSNWEILVHYLCYRNVFFAQQIEGSFLKPLVVNQHYVPISQIVLCLPVIFSKDMRWDGLSTYHIPTVFTVFISHLPVWIGGWNVCAFKWLLPFFTTNILRLEILIVMLLFSATLRT